MMRKIIFIFPVFYIFLMTGISNAEIRLYSKSFSVEPPKGWFVERKADEVVFTAPEAKDEEIFISVIATKTTSSLSLDNTWNKMKPLMTSKMIVLFDGTDNFANADWKRLDMKNKICDKDMRLIVLFTIKQGVKYSIKFNCPVDKYKDNIMHFENVKNSFKFKPS